MDQKEINAIKQIAKDFNSEISEQSRYVPFSDVTEYSYIISQDVEVFFIERRAQAGGSNNKHKRTIFQTPIPDINIEIQKASRFSRLFKGGDVYKVTSSNKRLKDQIEMNKDIREFLNSSGGDLRVRTKQIDSQSTLELRYEELILNQDVLSQSASFISKLKEIIVSEH